MINVVWEVPIELLGEMSQILARQYPGIIPWKAKAQKGLNTNPDPISKTQAGFQIDALRLVPDWLIFKLRRFDWLRVPSDYSL